MGAGLFVMLIPIRVTLPTWRRRPALRRSAATTGTLLYGRTSFWHSGRMIFHIWRTLVLTMVVSLFITLTARTFAVDPVDSQRRAIDEAVARVKPSLVR